MATAEQIEPVTIEVKNDTISSVKSFLSGGFGGMASVLVGYVYMMIMVNYEYSFLFLLLLLLVNLLI